MNLLDRRFLNISLSVNAIANSPTGTPTAGTQYIVGSNPSGAFASATHNQIARYNGSAWSFSTPKPGELEVLNLDSGEILQFNGEEWVARASLSSDSQPSSSSDPVAPVLAIVPSGSSLPATANTGEAFLNTSDAKIYTATAPNAWDSGSLTANGSRYASSTDHKIYVSNGSALIATNILNGDLFLNKEDNSVYAYDELASTFVKVGAVNTVTETHSLTADEVAGKGFTLNHSIATGQEDNTLLFVSGIAQIAGVDFSASGNSISWDNKALDAISLAEGDTFLIHYSRA